MLPVSYFERISATWKARTYPNGRERREGMRVDLRGVATLYTLLSEALADETPCRTREISRSGGSLLVGRKLKPGQEFVVRLPARADGAEHAMWCKARRSTSIDDLFVVGFTFVKVAYPAQVVKAGVKLDRVSWLAVDGDREPQDPYEDGQRAA